MTNLLKDFFHVYKNYPPKVWLIFTWNMSRRKENIYADYKNLHIPTLQGDFKNFQELELRRKV